MKNLTRLPEPYRSVWVAYKGMAQAVDLAVARLVEPPLAYDSVHNAFRRTDRRRMTMVKPSANLAETIEDMTPAEQAEFYAKRQPRNICRWRRANRPLAPDPTDPVRERLAYQFCGDADDPDARIIRKSFSHSLREIEEELLDGDDSVVGLMLVGRLVTSWAMTVWTDLELLDRTHELACTFPAAVRAKAALAESVDHQFRAALRAWESYCDRTRGSVPSLSELSRNRVSQYFRSPACAGAN
jgi:hypothetical protein